MNDLGQGQFEPDADVNLDAPVAVVRTAPRFAGRNPLILRKRFPEEIRIAVLSAFKKGVVNEEKDMVVGMSGRDFHKHLDTSGSIDELAHLECIAYLPELMKLARRIKSHDDLNPQQGSNIDKVHRFISVFGYRYQTSDYAVLLTVKEYTLGKYTLDEKNPVRLYHHRVGKMTPAPSTSSPVEQAGSSTPSSANSYTVRELLSGVNDFRPTSGESPDLEAKKRRRMRM